MEPQRGTRNERGRELSAKALRASGLPWALRTTYIRSRPLVLLYHDPAPEVFDAHLRWLGERFTFTTLTELTTALHEGSLASMPQRSVVVTLDDGHRGNRRLLPILRQHSVRPTIYVCSGIVGTERAFWFEATPDAGAYKRLPNDERLQRLAEAVGFEQEQPWPPPRQALSRDELIELGECAEIGCHTRFHPVLTTCDLERARDEIIGAKAELEALLGREVCHFAYPNGDWSPALDALVREAGFVSARRIDPIPVGVTTSPWALGCIGITDNASVDMLAAQVTGLPTMLRNLRRGRLSRRYDPIRLER